MVKGKVPGIYYTYNVEVTGLADTTEYGAQKTVYFKDGKMVEEGDWKINLEF